MRALLNDRQRPIHTWANRITAERSPTADTHVDKADQHTRGHSRRADGAERSTTSDSVDNVRLNATEIPSILVLFAVVLACHTILVHEIRVGGKQVLRRFRTALKVFLHVVKDPFVNGHIFAIH